MEEAKRVADERKAAADALARAQAEAARQRAYEEAMTAKREARRVQELARMHKCDLESRVMTEHWNEEWGVEQERLRVLEDRRRKEAAAKAAAERKERRRLERIALEQRRRAAAVRVQCWWRCILAKQALAGKRHARDLPMHKAAAKIQALWRGRRSRRYVCVCVSVCVYDFWGAVWRMRLYLCVHVLVYSLSLTPTLSNTHSHTHIHTQTRPLLRVPAHQARRALHAARPFCVLHPELLARVQHPAKDKKDKAGVCACVCVCVRIYMCVFTISYCVLYTHSHRNPSLNSKTISNSDTSF
jgi:hypothetical protein